MVRTFLSLYPRLRTSSLLGMHAGVGNRHRHLSGPSLGHSSGATSCRTQCLYFLPLPQGQGALRESFLRGTVLSCEAGESFRPLTVT
jgi:hypothetical protein